MKEFKANLPTFAIGLLLAVGNTLLPVLSGEGVTSKDIYMSIGFAVFGYLSKYVKVTGAGDDAERIKE